MLQRKMLGVWAERAGGEVAVAGKGWGCKALNPPQLVRGVSGFSLFNFCSLCCCLLQCTHLWFVVILCSVMGFIVSLVWLVFIFSGITRDEVAACELWAISHRAHRLCSLIHFCNKCVCLLLRCSSQEDRKRVCSKKNCWQLRHLSSGFMITVQPGLNVVGESCTSSFPAMMANTAASQILAEIDK